MGTRSRLAVNLAKSRLVPPREKDFRIDDQVRRDEMLKISTSKKNFFFAVKLYKTQKYKL